MLEQGVASAEDIDKAIKLGLNHPMGPFEMGDLVGLDVRLSILEHLHATLGETFRPSNLMRQYVQAGRLGRKTGRGVYDYDAHGKRIRREHARMLNRPRSSLAALVRRRARRRAARRPGRRDRGEHDHRRLAVRARRRRGSDPRAATSSSGRAPTRTAAAPASTAASSTPPAARSPARSRLTNTTAGDQVTPGGRQPLRPVHGGLGVAGPGRQRLRHRLRVLDGLGEPIGGSSATSSRSTSTTAGSQLQPDVARRTPTSTSSGAANPAAAAHNDIWARRFALERARR